jgi:hypothetical protein
MPSTYSLASGSIAGLAAGAFIVMVATSKSLLRNENSLIAYGNTYGEEELDLPDQPLPHNTSLQ